MTQERFIEKLKGSYPSDVVNRLTGDSGPLPEHSDEPVPVAERRVDWESRRAVRVEADRFRCRTLAEAEELHTVGGGTATPLAEYADDEAAEIASLGETAARIRRELRARQAEKY